MWLFFLLLAVNLRIGCDKKESKSTLRKWGSFVCNKHTFRFHNHRHQTSVIYNDNCCSFVREFFSLSSNLLSQTLTHTRTQLLLQLKWPFPYSTAQFSLHSSIYTLVYSFTSTHWIEKSQWKPSVAPIATASVWPNIIRAVWICVSNKTIDKIGCWTAKPSRTMTTSARKTYNLYCSFVRDWYGQIIVNEQTDCLSADDE